MLVVMLLLLVLVMLVMMLLLLVLVLVWIVPGRVAGGCVVPVCEAGGTIITLNPSNVTTTTTTTTTTTAVSAVGIVPCTFACRVIEPVGRARFTIPHLLPL